MNITKIRAVEIFNSQGEPTIACNLFLEDGSCFVSSVATGISKGKYDAVSLYDEDDGVSKAIEIIEHEIAPLLIDQAPDVVACDTKMIELDNTKDKSYLGANSMLAVSMAVVRAQAYVYEMPLYELIAYFCQQESISIPVPLVNMVQGGVHAATGLFVQEFLVIPKNISSFREAFNNIVLFKNTLQELLLKQGKNICFGGEGGFTTHFDHDEHVLDSMMQVVKHLNAEHCFSFGLDIAASQWYDSASTMYTVAQKKVSSDNLLKWYQKLLATYPITYIEDPFAEDDVDTWKQLTAQYGENIFVVGDDFFATNPERIYCGAQEKIANATIIKPDQIGTITETLQALQVCREYDMQSIVSHRSSETNDTFIVDLAVGANAGYIKAGGCTRGERLAKYNHLLLIEDLLAQALLED